MDMFATTLALVPQHTETDLRTHQPGRVVARLLPFGKVIEYQGAKITFDEGSVTGNGEMIPVTIDHGAGVIERIGKIISTYSKPDGLYGEIHLSDTTLGRDVRTLLLDGVLEDVSAGVLRDPTREFTRDGISHRFGTLDHVSIVPRGAWGNVPAGSKVLAAFRHQKGETQVEETTTTAPVAEETKPEVYASSTKVAELEKQIAELRVPTIKVEEKTRPGNFRNLQEFIAVQRAAMNGNTRARERMDLYAREAGERARSLSKSLSEFALDDDTTTTAAGLVPDYLSSEIIGLIDNFRPFVDSIPSDPVGDYGMSVIYPKVVTKPDVGVQSTEKTEVTTQAMDIDPVSVDLVTYAGASDVSMQLIERSQPSFVDRLYAELAGVYAERTDAASIAAVVAAAVAASSTAIVADLSTDAGATYGAFATGAAAIAAAIKRPADTVWVAADRFGELLALVDSEGRPLIVPEEQGPENAQGVGSFATFRFRYGGFRVIVDPHAADGTCLIGWSGAAATLELTPQQLRAVQVDLLGVNMGVWGLFATVTKYATGFYAITPS